MSSLDIQAENQNGERKNLHPGLGLDARRVGIISETANQEWS